MIFRTQRAALLAAGAALALLTGCATQQQGYDYTAFKAARPASILVLPPVNKTPEVLATPAMLARATQPLAESGYYVLPVALVNETLRQNGMTVPEEIRDIAPARLREIFAADAVLHITVEDYGQRYIVIDSVNTVRASASLIDLRSGQTLWEGSASASSSEQNSQGGGIAGILLTAVLRQIAGTLGDQGFNVAAIASQRLLDAGQPSGVLYGPRHPLGSQEPRAAAPR